MKWAFMNWKMIMYRIHYYESESGWGSDSWHVDYHTEAEAKSAYQACFDKYMNKVPTPSYYVRPTYLGAVEVNTNGS